MKKLLLIAFLILASCDSSGKTLFSLWKQNSGLILDLRGGQLDREMTIVFFLVDSSTCTAKIIMSGDNNSGTWSFGNNTCGEEKTNGMYTNDGTTLTVITANSYEIYH